MLDTEQAEAPDTTDDHPATRARSTSANNRAKGKRIVKLAKAVLEAQGAIVEIAPLQARFIGRGKVVMLASDYFGCWDLMAVWRGGVRAFVQVTTWEHISDRRAKIRKADFPCTECDLILGYVEGHGRHFRVLTGPDFLTEKSEIWKIEAEPIAG